MRIGHFLPWGPSIWTPSLAVRPAQLDDAPAISMLHEQSFARGWTSDEVEALLRKDTVNGFVARAQGWKRRRRLVGFVLVRASGAEAEILSVAVARHARRAGVGLALMREAMRHLYGERVESIMLEVDERNVGAITLYRRLGFERTARREAYYQDGERRHHALIMRCNLN